MSNTWGNHLKISLFGESHGTSIGIVLDGLPSGISFDFSRVDFEMARRRPGKNRFSTQRNEADAYEIQSGYFNGKTTGSPLCAIIKNSNTISSDYDTLQTKMRPSHADYTAWVKYKGYCDHRGGGHFSGRLTAPLCFAGALAGQLLRQKDIVVGSHLLSVHDAQDDAFDPVHISRDVLDSLRLMEFPVLNLRVGEQMQQEILSAKESLDSVGGVIESAVCGMPAGLGEPFFESLESRLASFIFSVPGVKGVSFGAGFSLSKMMGSEANDAFYMDEDGTVRTRTNHSGGINGGISNGMPILVKTAMRPTASIAREQETIDISEMKHTKLSVHGRHDPCIALRAVPVLDSVIAIVLMDILLEAGETFA